MVLIKNKFNKSKNKLKFVLFFVLLLTGFLSISWGIVLASTAGPKSGSNSINDPSTGNVWTNPSNSQTSNNVYASITLSPLAESNYIKATGFGFSLSTNAVVSGIQASIEKKASTATYVKDSHVYLVKNGVIAGTDKANTIAWTTSDVARAYGATNDRWGQTWTYSDINSSTFGIAISAKNTNTTSNRIAYIDKITITVSYTLDTVKPVTTNNIPSGWQNTDTTVAFTCTDTASGCLKTYYTIDGTTPTTSSNYVDVASNWQFTVSTSGDYIVKYFSKDNAGNSETVKTATNHLKIDKIAPTISATAPANNTVIKSITTSSAVNYTLSEAITSGSITMTRTGGTADASSPHTCILKGTALNVGAHTGFDMSNTTNSCTLAQSLVSGATYTFAFSAIDAVGNAATVSNTGVTFDNTVPTVNAGSAQTKSSSFTQTAVVTEAGSEIDVSSYIWSKISGPGTITFGSANALSTTISANVGGIYVIQFSVSDIAGNTGTSNFTLTWQTVPGQPTGLTATLLSGPQIKLDWVAPANTGGSNITGYKIERSIDGGITWEAVVEDTGSTATSYTNTGSEAPILAATPGSTVSWACVGVDGGAYASCSAERGNNNPPTVSGFTRSGSYCGTSGAGLLNFGWIYNDLDLDTESKFRFQIYEMPEGDLIIDRPIPSSTPSGALDGEPNNFQSVDVSTAIISDKINFGKNYSWFVTVYDEHDTPSVKTKGGDFTTPAHAYPFAEFDPRSQSGSLFGSIYTAQFIDKSKCYSTGSPDPYGCKTGESNTYSWVFGDGKTSQTKGDVSNDYTVARTTPYEVTLEVCDELSHCCPADSGSVTVNAGVRVPEWREISPF